MQRAGPGGHWYLQCCFVSSSPGLRPSWYPAFGENPEILPPTQNIEPAAAMLVTWFLLNRTCPYMRVADFSYKGWLATADHHCYRCLRILAYIFRNPFPSDIMADYSCFRDQVVVITGKLAKHFLMLYGGMASLDILVYWSKCPRKITYGRYFYYTSFWLCLQCWIKYINLNINTTCVNDSNHLHM